MTPGKRGFGHARRVFLILTQIDISARAIFDVGQRLHSRWRVTQ